MAFVIGKIKCYFCDGKDGLMHSVADYGLYGEVGKRKFYHPECLEMVQIQPEKFGHRMMDKALHLSELSEKNKKYNGTIKDDFNEKVEKLHMSHF